MAKQLQLRGGTTAQHSAFTGAVREVTVDTDKDVVVVHDGATVGGFPMAKKTDVDSALGTAVLLTGNQTIAGTKTFSSTISGSITGNAGSATTATTAGSCTGNSATATTASSCSGNSATATSATSATTATNLAGGSLGTIPYQSAAGTTAQLAAGTSGYLLKSNGAAAPSWSSIKTVNGTSLLASGDITVGNLSDTAHSFSGNGYQKLSNGLIMQWGRTAVNVSSVTNISFPIVFPTALFSVTALHQTDGSQSYLYQVDNPTTSYFRVRWDRPSGGDPQAPVHFIAIGY